MNPSRNPGWSGWALVLPVCLLALRGAATAMPVSATPAASADPITIIASARQAIEAANAGWLPAMERGDAASVAAAYAVDGVLITSKGVAIRGRPAIAALYRDELTQLGRVSSGPYLTVWRRGPDGTWAIIRNLVL